MEGREGRMEVDPERREMTRKGYALRVTPYASRFTFHVSRFTLLLLVLSVGVTVSSFADVVPPTSEGTIDYVVAVVNNQPITLSALENALIIDQATTLSALRNQSISEDMKEKSNQVRQKVLEKLIERQLLLQEAERSGILLMRWQEKVDVKIKEFRAQSPSDEEFYDQLKKSGLEYKDLEELFRSSLIVGELIARRFRSKSDEAIEQEAAQYFEQHKPDYIEPMQIQFQSIKVSSKRDDPPEQQAQAKHLAEEIYSRLQAGAELSDIQHLYQDNPNFFIVVNPEIETVDETEVKQKVAQLEMNQFSEPFLTPDGYLIAKLLYKKPQRQKRYEEVSQEIKEKLIQQQVEEQLEAWLKEQKEAADIRILDTEMEQIQVDNTTRPPQ
ncbi:SurA N-terminal domain-containing protein [Candidatus Poribacteria bacterium]|nr:SurA N-terminal domain-containing protein [Candidatus Poribacteria bacterium]